MLYPTQLLLLATMHMNLVQMQSKGERQKKEERHELNL